jgi:hypothetical protein
LIGPQPRSNGFRSNLVFVKMNKADGLMWMVKQWCLMEGEGWIKESADALPNNHYPADAKERVMLKRKYRRGIKHG